jgi:lactate permease
MSSTSLFLLGWTPLGLLAILAVVLRRPALELAIWGFGYVALLTVWAFRTPWTVVGLATVDGLLTTLPLLLVVFLGILFSQLLVSSGSLARLIDWLLSGLSQPLRQQVLITLGLGNFLEGASIIAEPMVAPMLTLTGVRPAGAAALSIVGYAGLMGVEMAGMIIAVLALVTGLPYQELGAATAWLSVPATLLMALCLPLFLPEPAQAWRQLPYLLGSALLVSLATLAAAQWLGIAIAGMVGGLFLVAWLLAGGKRRPTVPEPHLWADLAPFGMILVPLLLVNTIPALQTLTRQHLTFTLAQVYHVKKNKYDISSC